MGTFREAVCPTEALIWFWRCLSSYLVEKPWNSNLLIAYIWLNVDWGSPGGFSHAGTSSPVGSLSGERHLNAFVTLTFTLCYNFTSDFLTMISHRGEQLVPITRKAFATWVTAHKKHSWDHQLFYLFFFQFLLIEKLMRYISFPWRSPGKQWSDSPFPSCFGQCWWYSTAKFCLIEASSMLLASYFSHQTLIIWW